MPETSHPLSDAESDPGLRQEMTDLAASLDGFFNGNQPGQQRTTGFVLLVFPFNAEGRCDYISNTSDHENLALLFKGLSARFEEQAALKGPD